MKTKIILNVHTLGWAKPDLWGLRGESWCIIGSFWHSEGLLRCTMTLLQGPKDPVLPNLTYTLTQSNFYLKYHSEIMLMYFHKIFMKHGHITIEIWRNMLRKLQWRHKKFLSKELNFHIDFHHVLSPLHRSVEQTQYFPVSGFPLTLALRSKHPSFSCVFITL